MANHKTLLETESRIHLTIRATGHTSGRINIIADPDVVSTELDFSGDQEDLDAISVENRDGTVTIVLPGNAGGFTSGNYQAGGSINISGGSFIGSVVGGNNRVVINGVDVTHLGEMANLHRPINATIRVPAMSTVYVDLTGNDVETHGPLATANIKTQSGDIGIYEARSVVARTQSGDITLGAVPPAAVVSAQSMSGDITAQNIQGMGNLKSMSGSITAHHVNPDGPLTLDTMSGNINYGIASLEAVNRIHANTMSGRIHTFTR